MPLLRGDSKQSFLRRGIGEGFFAPLWSTAHRQPRFEFDAARGMNTYPSRSKTAIDTLRVFPVQISINLNDAAM